MAGLLSKMILCTLKLMDRKRLQALTFLFASKGSNRLFREWPDTLAIKLGKLDWKTR